jgi:predicted transposase YdaD
MTKRITFQLTALQVFSQIGCSFSGTFPIRQGWVLTRMHEYDVTLKDLLLDAQGITLRELTGLNVTLWRDVELPKVSNPCIDLLGQTGDGILVHIELQSTNDANMPFRMLDYGLRVYERHEVFPRQTVLYLGQAPLRMSNRLLFPGLSFEYRLVDIRELDGALLCESSSIGDNIISLLARWPDRTEAIRRILRRIAELEPARRGRALAQLMILAGLRKLAAEVEREARQVPILDDILDHEVLGREYKRGRQEGRQEGELHLLRRQLERRFGSLPAWADERLRACPVEEIERIGERLMEVSRLDELLP